MSRMIKKNGFGNLFYQDIAETKTCYGNSQIPQDLVANFQPIDIVGVIL
jgi:hypothetical protein